MILILEYMINSVLLRFFFFGKCDLSIDKFWYFSKMILVMSNDKQHLYIVAHIIDNSELKLTRFMRCLFGSTYFSAF